MRVYRPDTFGGALGIFPGLGSRFFLVWLVIQLLVAGNV